MIFGGNDYPENTHRAGFSPGFASHLMKGAGFFEVKVLPLPSCATDMIIEAHKSHARILRGVRSPNRGEDVLAPSPSLPRSPTPLRQRTRLTKVPMMWSSRS